MANAEEILRDSVFVGRGRSSSLRSLASFEESGRSRRLHREVVHGNASSVDMAIGISVNSYGIDGYGGAMGGRICCAMLRARRRCRDDCLFV